MKDIFIDNGSATDIIFRDYFERMNLEVELREAKTACMDSMKEKFGL